MQYYQRKFRKMNYFTAVLVCSLLAAALADSGEIKEKIKDSFRKLDAAHEHCNKDAATRVDKEALKKMREEHAPAPENLGAHTLCISKELLWQNADGMIDTEMLRPKLKLYLANTTNQDEIINKCLEQQATPEETAKHLFGCIMKNIRRPHGGHPQDH